MKKLTFLMFILFAQLVQSQDTFSIVAVDTITGEIGSAGASCIDESQIEGGALIISDVMPGRGAIHTQSYWNSTNQQNAHDRMEEGMSPEEIIQWLSTHDAQNNPAVRQYGIVDFDSAGHARSAGFTGVNCLNYKNHIAGINYCIQGNILLGQMILDSIEARFLNTEGSFAEKMMAALQGANVVGADTRCTENGTSSLSAFIRVARPEDLPGGFYCDLNVPSVPEGMEPIDSLQTLFNAWLETVVGVQERSSPAKFAVYPNPASKQVSVGQLDNWTVGQLDSWTVGQLDSWTVGQLGARAEKNITIVISNILGEKIYQATVTEKQNWKMNIDLEMYQSGIYFVSAFDKSMLIQTQKLIIIK